MSNPLLNRQFDIVREDLHRRFAQLLPTARIDAILDEVIAELTAEAKVDTFLPVLAERESAERILTEAEATGQEAFSRKEILFADERNSGRSQIAAALAHALVGDAVFVRSIGLNPEGGINQLALQVLQDRGIDTSMLYQKSITPRLSHRADVVVLMGIDEVPGVPGNRYVSWDIADPESADEAAMNAIVDDVEKHVRKLLSEMEILDKSPQFAN